VADHKSRMGEEVVQVCKLVMFQDMRKRYGVDVHSILLCINAWGKTCQSLV